MNNILNNDIINNEIINNDKLQIIISYIIFFKLTYCSADDCDNLDINYSEQERIECITEYINIPL